MENKIKDGRKRERERRGKDEGMGFFKREEGDVQLMIQVILHIGGFLGIRNVDVDVDDVDAVLVGVAGVLAHAAGGVSRVLCSGVERDQIVCICQLYSI